MTNEEALILGAKLGKALPTYFELQNSSGNKDGLAKRLGISLRSLRHQLGILRRYDQVHISHYEDGKAVYSFGGGTNAKRPTKPRGKAKPKFDQQTALEAAEKKIKATAERLRSRTAEQEERLKKVEEKLQQTAHGHKVVVGNVTRHVMR